MDNEIEYDQNVVRIYANVLRLIKVVKSAWKIVLLFIVLANAIGYWIFINEEDVYKSGSAIIIEEKGNSGGLGSIANMAAQFGMSSGIVPDESKVIQLLNTKAVIYPALLTVVEINGKLDYLANHFLDLQLNNQSKRITKNKVFANLSVEDHQILLFVYSSLISPKTNLYLVESSKEGGVIIINVFSKNNRLSYEINKNILASIEDFYSGNMKEKEETSIFIMEDKLNIISSSMDSMENSYAQWKEKNFQSISAASLIEEMRFKRSIELYNGMFMETYKTLEIKRVNAEFENEYIRIVNFPTLPKSPKRYSLVNYLIVSILAALIFSLIFIAAFNAFKDLNQKVQSLE